MKKLNKKGFTLVELLAVVVILGILMLVAIPAIQKAIQNSKKGTFADSAKEVVNAVKNAYAADELGETCPNGVDGTYKVDYSEAQKLLETEFKSPFHPKEEIEGYILITVTKGKATYKAELYEKTSKAGIDGLQEFHNIKPENIKDKGVEPVTASGTSCTVSQ